METFLTCLSGLLTVVRQSSRDSSRAAGRTSLVRLLTRRSILCGTSTSRRRAAHGGTRDRPVAGKGCLALTRDPPDACLTVVHDESRALVGSVQQWVQNRLEPIQTRLDAADQGALSAPRQAPVKPIKPNQTHARTRERSANSQILPSCRAHHAQRFRNARWYHTQPKSLAKVNAATLHSLAAWQ